MHVVKSAKVYAVLESVVELRGSIDEVSQYLRKNKFVGDMTINYQQGGITNVVTKEKVPLTMEQLESLCQKV